MADMLLGLIGDNIVRSKAPQLHMTAGRLTGLDVRYDRLIPKDLGVDFDVLFDDCAKGGYRGINVTYPYKERAAARVQINDPLVKSIGAVNTVLFEESGSIGYNTDYSGFVAGYRRVIGRAGPGSVCMIGAGGVGKAIAFGLVALGLTDLRIVERDLPKAEALADALRTDRPALKIRVCGDSQEAVAGAAGLINCTPVGMVGYEGTPLPRDLMANASWAFDAVYTPVDTEFLRDASAAGLTIVSGYELFFYQGVHAFDLFAGRTLDHEVLRRALDEANIVDAG